MALGWPVGAFATSLRTRRALRAQARPHGLGVLFDMYWLALRHSIPPIEYALYRLYEPGPRAAMHDYVYWNDLPGLAALNMGCGADRHDVQDKSRFADICAAHDLPFVPTLAVFARGRQIFPDTPFIPAAPALWVKALRLKGGAGAARWTRDGAGYRNDKGQHLSPAELSDRLKGDDCLVQPLVENHTVIAQITNGALAALRIVTGRTPEGDPVFVAALLSLPHGRRIHSIAAIMCSIDPATGAVRHAALPDGAPVTHHPDTGVALPGIVLPFWDAARALAIRAHATGFGRFVFLGWDIALTDDGPILLEANSGWGALYHQILDGPLGRTPLADVLDRYV